MEWASELASIHRRYRNKVGAPREFYRIENRDDRTVIHLFDEIGWFGTTADAFVKEIGNITSDTIELHINSEGGDAFDGIAMYGSLREHSAQVHVIVDGLAASAASVVAMAGDTVTMKPQAMMMIHDAWGLAVGNSADHRELAEVLDKLSDNIASVYAQRTGGTVEEWREQMRAETWLTADEALDAKLIDTIDTHAASDVAAAFDISVFSDPPAPAENNGSLSIDPDDLVAQLREAIKL